jgi:hypothetical protein
MATDFKSSALPKMLDNKVKQHVTKQQRRQSLIISSVNIWAHPCLQTASLSRHVHAFAATAKSLMLTTSPVSIPVGSRLPRWRHILFTLPEARPEPQNFETSFHRRPKSPACQAGRTLSDYVRYRNPGNGHQPTPYGALYCLIGATVFRTL